jgi:hypothetical protein
VPIAGPHLRWIAALAALVAPIGLWYYTTTSVLLAPHLLPRMAGRRLTLALLVAAASLAAGASSSSKYMRFDLLRRREPGSLAELWRMDRERMAFIAARRARRRTTETKAPAGGEESFAMPLSSGAYTGTGQYFVRFRVGTPAQPFLLVADTGSDLTWVKCHRPAGSAVPYPFWNESDSAPSPSPRERAFRPDDSRTWRPISCASDTCVESLPFSLAACPTPGSPCAYDYRSVSVLSSLPPSLVYQIKHTQSIRVSIPKH